MTPAEYRTQRERRGTPAEVAALLDVARETLSRRETGAQKITREAALALLALPAVIAQKAK